MVCSIFGRAILPNVMGVPNLFSTIERLISECGVTEFLFGNGNNFSANCYNIITYLKTGHPDIKRTFYFCENESYFTEEELKEKIKILSEEEKVDYYDEERAFPTKYPDAYKGIIEMNLAMINKSDVCLFYQSRIHSPVSKFFGKSYVSAAAVALLYAKQKKKKIVMV